MKKRMEKLEMPAMDEMDFEELAIEEGEMDEMEDEEEMESPLDMLSDEELIAEFKARGLSLDDDMEDMEDEDLA
jgi:hypothetical protein